MSASTSNTPKTNKAPRPGFESVSTEPTVIALSVALDAYPADHMVVLDAGKAVRRRLLEMAAEQRAKDAGALMSAAPEPQYWSLNLGAEDCEYCGTNFDSIEVSLEDGDYRYSSSLGCYGGESYQSRSKDAFVAWLRTQDEWFRQCFPVSPDALSELIDAVDAGRDLPHVPE